jgi:hypothetical protein
VPVAPDDPLAPLADDPDVLPIVASVRMYDAPDWADDPDALLLPAPPAPLDDPPDTLPERCRHPVKVMLPL